LTEAGSGDMMPHSCLEMFTGLGERKRNVERESFGGRALKNFTIEIIRRAFVHQNGLKAFGFKKRR